MWCCYRTAWVLWKVKLVPVLRRVECDVDGTEEVSNEVEEAVDIKNEIPEAISFPQIKTEQDLRLWVVCEVEGARAFRPYIA